MRVLAIDPGLVRSGWVIFDGERVHAAGIAENPEMLKRIGSIENVDSLAIEMIAGYGMPVGREVFETVWWIGRFTQAWKTPNQVLRIYRRDVKIDLCGSARAKDPNVRQALIDLFGPGRDRAIGTRKNPGPLYGVSGHAWAALAVAVIVERNQFCREAAE